MSQENCITRDKSLSWADACATGTASCSLSTPTPAATARSAKSVGLSGNVDVVGESDAGSAGAATAKPNSPATGVRPPRRPRTTPDIARRQVTDYLHHLGTVDLCGPDLLCHAQ